MNTNKRPCVMWWNSDDKAFESFADCNETPSHWMPILTIEAIAKREGV